MQNTFGVSASIVETSLLQNQFETTSMKAEKINGLFSPVWHVQIVQDAH